MVWNEEGILHDMTFIHTKVPSRNQEKNIMGNFMCQPEKNPGVLTSLRQIKTSLRQEK